MKASSNKYSAFVEEVMKEIDEKSDVDPSADGLKIYTTLDTKAQDKLDELMDGDTAGFTEGMQGGVTLLDTKPEKSVRLVPEEILRLAASTMLLKEKLSLVLLLNQF